MLIYNGPLLDYVCLLGGMDEKLDDELTLFNLRCGSLL